MRFRFSLGRWWRFLRWQRHSGPCRDGIDIARDQHREVAGMMDVTGNLSGAISSAPKDIGAGWTDNGRAGVLGDHQMIKADAPFLIREWQVGVDEEGRAVHM